MYNVLNAVKREKQSVEVSHWLFSTFLDLAVLSSLLHAIVLILCPAHAYVCRHNWKENFVQKYSFGVSLATDAGTPS